MRINIYKEELTNDFELVVKEANGHKFYGMRFFLESPPDLHHSDDDDDRNAVTFWHTDLAELANLFHIAEMWLLAEAGR